MAGDLAAGHAGEIGHGRPRSELTQDVIAARAGRELGHAGGPVLEIAEGDGLGGTRLLTGRLDVAVLEGPGRFPRIVLRLLDALHAHGALLHDAELAHGDVGVELDVERGGPAVVEPVEAAHVVRAVVAAVARAHATIVDLRVEPFRGVIGGVDWTHWLARRDFAVLTEHRLEDVLGLALGPVLPALEPDPLLGASVGDLGLAHHRYVVLRRARGHAGLAARAGIRVHRDAPAILGILDGGIHGRVARALRRATAQLHLTRGGQAHHLHDLAVVVVEGRLRDGQGLARARLGERDLDGEEREPSRDRIDGTPEKSHGVRAAIEHDVAEVPRAQVARLRVGAGIVVAQSHGDGHRSRMERGRHPSGQLYAAVGRGELDYVAPRDAELLRRLRGHLDPAAPRHLCHGVGRFLQPGLIRAPSVVETRRGIDDEGVGAVALELDRLEAHAARVELRAAAGGRGSRCCAPDPTATKRLLPEVDGALATAVLLGHALPLLAHVVLEARPPERALALLGAESLTPDGEEDVARGLAVDGLAVDGHRPHRRLHQADDAIPRHVVAPRLERMERGQQERRLG